MKIIITEGITESEIIVLRKKVNQEKIQFYTLHRPENQNKT